MRPTLSTLFGGIRGGSNCLGTLFGVWAYVKFVQHLFWQQNCVFGKDYFGNLPCMRRMFTKLMMFMPFGYFLMEFVVVRINWEHILAFAPIINDGNIYWTKKSHFWNTLL